MTFDRSVLPPPKLTWNMLGRDPERIGGVDPAAITPEWGWAGATGKGVSVCVVDSGVEGAHPMVGEVQSSHAVRETTTTASDGSQQLEHDVVSADATDSTGHGTACAGIIRSIAPDCEIHSLKVLGAQYRNAGATFVAGLQWAAAQGFDVVSVSVSTTRRQYAEALRDACEQAYFGNTVMVASAHNSHVESFPWRFASVVSVGSHDEVDSEVIYYNPRPPVEFFARGVDVDTAWRDGGRTVSSGNSFATPHVAGYCALVRDLHPNLPPFQVKGVLYLTATNVRGDHDHRRD